MGVLDNIKIADRFIELRKQNHFSQEELAEKLGVSRQAVSKWERAETLPNTESAIMIAKLYKISLDELFDIKSENEIENEDNNKPKEEINSEIEEYPFLKKAEDVDDIKVFVGEREKTFTNMSTYQNTKSEDIGLFSEQEQPPFSTENIAKPEVQPDIIKPSGNSLFFANSKYNDTLARCDSFFKTDIFKFIYKSYSVWTTMAFVFFGALWTAWECAWILFLTIPLFYTTVPAIKKRNPNIFCYPVLVTMCYVTLGFLAQAWDIGLFLFFTVPLYYIFINTFYKRKK